MSATLVGTLVTGTGVTTLSLNPTAIGNAYAIAVRINDGTSVVTSVTGGNCTGWAKVAGSFVANSQSHEIWLGRATATGSATVTVANTVSSLMDLDAQQASSSYGTTAGWAKDGSQEGNRSDGTSTTVQFPTLVPGGTSWYVGHAEVPSGTSFTSPSAGYTLTTDADGNPFITNAAVSASTSPTCTVSPTSVSWSLAVLIVDSGSLAYAYAPVRVANRRTGPAVLRFHFRLPYSSPTSNDPIPPTFGYIPVRIANPYVGPVVLRRRFRQPYITPSTPGATAWLATADDALASLSEAMGRAFIGVRTNADSIGSLTEAVARAIMAKVRTGADSLASLSETVSGLKTFPRTAADSISSLTESASRAAGTWVRSGSDSIGSLTEAVARGVMAKARSAGDSISSLAESAVRAILALARTGADSVSSLTEGVVRGVMAKVRTGADSIGSLIEAVGRLGIFGRTVGDAVSAISEAVIAVKSGAGAFVATVGDSISTLTESVGRAVMAKARTTGDSVSSLAEATVRGAMAKARTAGDTVGSLTEAAIRSAMAKVRTAADSVPSISEVAAAVKGGAVALVRAAADGIGSLFEAVHVVITRAHGLDARMTFQQPNDGPVIGQEPDVISGAAIDQAPSIDGRDLG